MAARLPARSGSTPGVAWSRRVPEGKPETRLRMGPLACACYPTDSCARDSAQWTARGLAQKADEDGW